MNIQYLTTCLFYSIRRYAFYYDGSFILQNGCLQAHLIIMQLNILEILFFFVNVTQPLSSENLKKYKTGNLKQHFIILITIIFYLLGRRIHYFV